MRDKDAQLIFENYRNRVIVNEVAAALAVPAAQGIGGFMSWIAGTAVGAVVVDQAIKVLEKIPEFKRNRIESKINETNRILSLNPEEIRSHYEIINAIKKEGNSTLSTIAEKFKQPIDIFRSAQDNANITIDTYYAVLTTSIEAHREVMNFQDSLDREIDQVISKSDLADVEKERIKAQRAKDKLEHKERMAQLENEKLRLELEKQKGGGGGGKDPKKGGGFVTGAINTLGLILKLLSENYKTLKGLFWATIILVPGFGIFLIKTLFSSGKEYAKAGQEFTDDFKQEIEKEKPVAPKATPKPTPKEGKFTPSRYIPEGEDASTPITAKASPTPYKKKGNW